MPVYRIHRLRDTQRQSLRWAAHTAGVAEIKPKNYAPDGTAEAPTPYAAWSMLLKSDRRLQVGDLLESPEGELRIYKYVGFEPARWVLPEEQPGAEAAPPAPD